MGVWGRDWGSYYLRVVWAVTVIGDVNIVGVGDEVGEPGRDWNTESWELGQRFWNIYSM